MLLIRGGRVIDPRSSTDAQLDILVEGGVIRRIHTSISPEAGWEVVEAGNLVVAPGFIDTHVHFRDPGQTHKEDLRTGAAAAAKGGFTAVIAMANTRPVVDSVPVLGDILARAKDLPIRLYQAATLTRGMAGEELTDLESLRAVGAACFTDDGKPVSDVALVLRALCRARKLGAVVSFHEEEEALLAGHGVNEGPVADALNIPGAAAVAEDVLVARDCMLALHTEARVVIQHISTAAAVAAVRAARALGADVRAEATPHHFSLTQEAVLTQGTLAKMNPPLRTERDRAAVIEGLRDGTIEIIATDHAPHAPAEKALPLSKAPSGIIGLETALALGVTNLVRPGHLTLRDLIARMSAGPASCYRLPGGGLLEGGPADLVLFDPDARWEVRDFASKSANSPFIGQSLYGLVHRTICAGKTVYRLPD